MVNKKYLILFLFSIILGGICLKIGYARLMKEQSECKTELNAIWRQIVNIDCTERMHQTGVWKMHTHSSSSLSSTVKIVDKNDSLIMEKTHGSKAVLKEESDYMADQLFLARKNPINVFRLDSLFQVHLKKNGYTVETAVSYYDIFTKKTFYSTQDSAFYIKAHPLEWMNIVGDSLLVLNGYVKIDSVDFMKSSNEAFWWWVIGCVILLITISYIIRKQILESKMNISNNQVLIDCSKLTLSYGDTSITLSVKVFQLFLFLSEGMGYSRKYDELYKKLWDKEGGDKKRLEQLITRLRKELSVIPVIKIVTIRGFGLRLEVSNGYELVVESENSNYQNDTILAGKSD